MIKFQKYAIVNTQNKAKARVWYSLDNRTDGRKCVTIYAKDYTSKLRDIFGTLVKNDSDIQQDYFETDKVVLFENHLLYSTARFHAEEMRAILDKRLEDEKLKYSA